jgi:hypothetical protein
VVETWFDATDAEQVALMSLVKDGNVERKKQELPGFIEEPAFEARFTRLVPVYNLEAAAGFGVQKPRRKRWGGRNHRESSSNPECS